ncbi:MAG: hypothetical protein HYZ50_23530 [Deltaproteobacteria bacterium]|nr:hypothetical protein [Deltaproteobacteria bacterium]
MNQSKGRGEVLEFKPRGGGWELPSGFGVVSSAVFFPSGDFFEDVAYLDDGQVRSVRSTFFDKNLPTTVSGKVEHLGRLFYSNRKHMVLIMIYSDSRLAELGGEQEIQRRRYLEWQLNFDRMLSASRNISS